MKGMIYRSLAVMAVSAVLALPSHAENVYIYNTNNSGTYGNDTASTLYLRPLNNAMLGPAYFGQGYPRSASTYYTSTAPVSGSGVAAANAYLQNTGWYTWKTEREELVRKIESLEKRLAELEMQITAQKESK